MDLFTLVAKLGLDTSEYEKGIKFATSESQKAKEAVEKVVKAVDNVAKGLVTTTNAATKTLTDYRRDVATLAQQYRRSGDDMSTAMKKAYAEIDKSLYDMSKSAQKSLGDVKDETDDVGKKQKTSP